MRVCMYVYMCVCVCACVCVVPPSPTVLVPVREHEQGVAMVPVVVSRADGRDEQQSSAVVVSLSAATDISASVDSTGTSRTDMCAADRNGQADGR